MPEKSTQHPSNARFLAKDQYKNTDGWRMRPIVHATNKTKQRKCRQYNIREQAAIVRGKRSDEKMHDTEPDTRPLLAVWAKRHHDLILTESTRQKALLLTRKYSKVQRAHEHWKTIQIPDPATSRNSNVDSWVLPPSCTRARPQIHAV